MELETCVWCIIDVHCVARSKNTRLLKLLTLLLIFHVFIVHILAVLIVNVHLYASSSGHAISFNLGHDIRFLLHATVSY